MKYLPRYVVSLLGLDYGWIADYRGTSIHIALHLRTGATHFGLWSTGSGERQRQRQRHEGQSITSLPIAHRS